jgi:hypothetical protein
MGASPRHIGWCSSLIGQGGTQSKRLVLPEGLTLWFLPAYTPQLNPAERL